MKFHVGQKVVCVNDDGHHGDEALPKSGAYYTIREIVSGTPEGGLRLMETAGSGVFRVSRFFPVVTTNIDVFMRMLTTLPYWWAEEVEYEAFMQAFERGAFKAGELGNEQ